MGVREVLPPPLCDDRDGLAALRGAPAPPVPCNVAAGEVGGSVSALELAVPVRVSENLSYRGACAAPWRGRSVSDVLSGGVEADDSFLAARDRTRGHGQALSTGTRPMLAAAGHTSDRHGAPLARLAGRPREEVGPVGAHGGGARPGVLVR